ncbi:MAG: thiolase family protein [Deltaproteobacteria bacterium]|nr:thiolase family protein [Deltaproteobacteria bacterium]
MLTNSYIPYGAWWSSPFVKWQGSLASQHPLELAARCAKRTLEDRAIDPRLLSSLVLGLTVPSRHAFYGAPWVAAMLGAPELTGPTVMQACATGARALWTAATSVASGEGDSVLVVAADKTSNGPHLYYPDPAGAGGRGRSEDWVWDNFNFDPVPRNAMIETAENVAKEGAFAREAQDELTLLRYSQYADALGAFQSEYMVSPLELLDAGGKKVVAKVEGDEGVFPTSADGLRKLKPVLPGGTVTFGSQTHPADGNAGLIVTTREKAKAFSRSPGIEVRVVSYAQANAKKGFMAQAAAPAAKRALELAGFNASEVTLKTHNPFAVNDLFLARELDRAPETFNRFGSPLVYGHPQGPTGIRCIIELAVELARKGGGRGLFTGCAAGDTAAAVCIEVGP